MKLIIIYTIGLFISIALNGQEVDRYYSLENNEIYVKFADLKFENDYVLLDDKKIKYASLSQIILDSKPAKKDLSGFLELNDGSMLLFSDLIFDNEVIILQNAILGEVQISILNVRFLSFKPIEDKEFDQAFYKNRFNIDRSDILNLKNNEQLVTMEGMVRKIDKKALSVLWKNKERKIDLEKILMIKFSSAKKNSIFKGISIQLSDSSIIRGSKIVNNSGKLSLNGGAVASSLFFIENISKIEMQYRSIITLSNLNIDQEIKEGQLLFNHGAQINRSYHKSSLVGSEREFKSGFGVHSDSQLLFTLPEGVETIEGYVSFDKPNNFSKCVAEIRVDSNSVWRSELNAKKTEYKFSIEIKGSKKLLLSVIGGEDLDPGDSVIWGDVKLKMKE